MSDLKYVVLLDGELPPDFQGIAYRVYGEPIVGPGPDPDPDPTDGPEVLEVLAPATVNGTGTLPIATSLEAGDLVVVLRSISTASSDAHGRPSIDGAQVPDVGTWTLSSDSTRLAAHSVTGLSGTKAIAYNTGGYDMQVTAYVVRGLADPTAVQISLSDWTTATTAVGVAEAAPPLAAEQGQFAVAAALTTSGAGRAVFPTATQPASGWVTDRGPDDAHAAAHYIATETVDVSAGISNATQTRVHGVVTLLFGEPDPEEPTGPEVVEVLAPAELGASASGSIPIATDLQPDDLVVVLMAKTASGANTLSINGAAPTPYGSWLCGGTSTGTRLIVSTATGLTGAHALTYDTSSFATRTQITVYVIRGLSNPAITASSLSDWGTTNTAANTDEGGPSLAVDAGQVVIAVGAVQAGTPAFPSNATPSTGWTVDRALEAGTTGRSAVIHQEIDAAGSVQVNVASTASTPMASAVFVLGDPA